ncbi:MAG: 50S ribosomal protein L17 [Candidatus Levybacteria bacterium]|nr:50S ribosomal protein L17 [Candidatus Levybacteria bacterium]
MRKQVFGRRFKRDKNERKALFSGLISAMVLKGQIKTTEEKAKAVRGDLEKLVTKAKKGEIARRLLAPKLKSFEIDKMINEIAPAFKNRNGGYTRIIKIGRRFNDDASLALMQWTEEIIKAEKPATTASNAALRSLAKTKIARKTSKRTSSKGTKTTKKATRKSLSSKRSTRRDK